MAYSIAPSYPRAMAIRSFLLAGCAGLLLAPQPADAQSRRREEQRGAYEAARAGELRPFPEIVAAGRREAGGAAMIGGTEFDREAGVYRLKFMRDGSVFWIDVDGRTAQVIGRSN